MSEWHVGQAGNTGAGSRPGLAAALMFRVGGNQAASNGSGAGATALTAEKTSFSDVLRERSVQQPQGVSSGNRNGFDRADAARREPEGGRRDVTDMPARSHDNARSPVESATAPRDKEPVAASVDTTTNEPETVSGSDTSEPTVRNAMSEVATEQETEATQEQEASPEAYAGVLAMLIETMQTIIEDLADQAATAAEDVVQVDEAGAAMQQPSLLQMLETLTETIRQMLEGLAVTGEAPNTLQSVPLPQALLQAMRTWLDQADTLKTDLSLQDPAANNDAMAGLLAQLQTLANTVREQIQLMSPADITADTASDILEETLVSAAPMDEAPDARQGEAGGENNRGREMPPAFAAAANLTGTAQDPAVQGGVSAAAMAGGRTFGQEVARVAQAAAPAMPQMPEMPETARAVTSQVVTRLQTMSGDERHEMALQLKPENLGKIQLRIVEERGLVLAKFTAESEKVRAILESNMQLLRDALEKNGMTVAELSVSVGQRQHHDNTEQPGSRNDNGSANRRSDQSGMPDELGSVAEVDRGLRMTRRIAEYLYGPDSTMSLKA